MSEWQWGTTDFWNQGSYLLRKWCFNGGLKKKSKLDLKGSIEKGVLNLREQKEIQVHGKSGK